MGTLSARRHAALAAVIQACPDAQLDKLASAVTLFTGKGAQELAVMVSDEVRDRARRVIAFGPVLAMFQPRADGVPALSFPASVLTRVWREACKGEEAFLPLLDGVATFTGEWTLGANRLCARASAILRDRPQDVWPGYQLPPEGAPPVTPLELAGCFDLTPLARQALPRLEVWLERPDGNQLAGLRLLIQDANLIGPDGGRRMVDILFSHVADAERMLRVVTRSSRTANNELVLSHSEMGVFVERLLQSVSARVERIAAVRPEMGPSAMAEVVNDVTWCASVLAEMDVSLQLRPDSPWGKAARMARVTTAGQISGLMKSASAAAHAALPMQRQKLAGTMTRMAPWLEAPAEGEALDTALALLTVVTTLRSAAAVFGCESERAQLRSDMTAYLSAWANEALDHIADGEVENVDQALRLVGVAARLLTTIDALDAARAVRRRASTAEAARAASKQHWNRPSPPVA